MRIALKKDSVLKEMELRGWSNYDLAKRMEVSPPTVYRVFNGDRQPGNSFIAQLLKAFNSEDFCKFFIFVDVLPKGNGEKVYHESIISSE
ncbi:helix-turn-helix transcriptional regulator [Bacillus toyonensis]|uniref:helix-turn-helix domain-containing protein n=1 Tax=Bacillus TaxID=1386 RepID=UPI00032D791D|nr:MULTISPECIES: helix-turn-helix transcriptional regulator [Bacillus]EOP40077.1 hypothetical protein IKI_02922 [Bacillus toyonensis]